MKTLIELEANDCRFPFGESESEGGFTFCAAPQLMYVLRGEMRKSSYCREHHFRCTVVSSEARAAA
jgi:hypothetical protein